MAENTEIESIVKGLDTIEEHIKSVESDNKASQEAVQKKLAELGEEQLKFSKALAEMDQKNEAIEAEKAAPQDIGNAFIKSQAYAGYDATRHASFEFHKSDTPVTTAASNTVSRGNVAAPHVIPGMLTMPDQPLVVENLIPHIPVASNSIEYMKEGSMTNGAKIVDEAAAKPETTFSAPSLNTATVVTLAHWTKITKQLAADAPAYAAYINAKLLYGLNAKIDSQLITGTGSSGQLAGMLKSGNFTDMASTIAAELPTNATLFDFALYLKAELEKLYVQPQCFILNPMDWTALACMKDAQKRYILGGPQMIATKSLWGVPVVTTASMTQGKFLFGNFQLGASIFDREGITIDMSEHDDTNFEQNLITVRVERRMGFAVERPNVIFGGDWEVPSQSSGS